MNAEKAKVVLSEFRSGKYKKTRAEAMAFIGLGNISILDKAKESQEEAIQYYEKAVTSARGGKLHQQALYYLARAYEVNNKDESALRTYTSLLAMYPSTEFRNLTKKHMSMILDKK